MVLEIAKHLPYNTNPYAEHQAVKEEEPTMKPLCKTHLKQNKYIQANAQCPNAQVPSRTRKDQEKSLQEAFSLALYVKLSESSTQPSRDQMPKHWAKKENNVLELENAGMNLGLGFV